MLQVLSNRQRRGWPGGQICVKAGVVTELDPWYSGKLTVEPRDPCEKLLAQRPQQLSSDLDAPTHILRKSAMGRLFAAAATAGRNGRKLTLPRAPAPTIATVTGLFGELDVTCCACVDDAILGNFAW